MLTLKKVGNINDIISEVGEEVVRATRLHKPMNSPHEAESVIREEFEEFWDEVKKFNLPKGRDTRPAMREELIQLAAMAVRAISDVIDKPEEFCNNEACPCQQGKAGFDGNIKQIPVVDNNQVG